MRHKLASTARVFLLRLASTAVITLLCVLISRAGGPKNIAGTVYFDPSVSGQPLTWPQGKITYFTDQGNLSPILPNSLANTLVANSFAVWSTVPTAALAITNPGSLAEDVSGANVIRNADGTISMPADVQLSAIGAPIGIVYDYDGAVTNALLGAGAGDASQCFYNAVFGGNDNYGPLATFEHALIVINGQCAQQPFQLIEIQYRLVRVIGTVLGVGWSQLNVNVQTGSPPPTSDDYAGFPVMHFFDIWNCVPITLCYPNPYQLSMDDIAAISRLYPVTSQNQSAFPDKQVFAANTAQIHGSVWFTDTHGVRTQPMQGVNVVARWIDPATGKPSRRFAASSVSGFLYTGNRGNPITGTKDALGDSLPKWGSQDTALEGFFYLAGLQVPNGGTAQYQLTVEALDSQWSAGVGPYSPGPVSPSGWFQPITVTISTGRDVDQDILMTGTAQPLPKPATSWTSPSGLPPSGDWLSSLRHDTVDYFELAVQADRTLSIAATALDEAGRPSSLKTQPVIGIWSANNPPGTIPPAFTPSPFNSLVLDTTRLDAQVLQSGNLLIGISDVRGDVRPDFRYHGRVLYADRISPARVGVNGGVVAVEGTGLGPGLTATMGGKTVAQLGANAGQILLSVPAHSDGSQSIAIADPATGASTMMGNVLTYGAGATDNIVLLYAGNSTTAVGTQAGKPVAVRVLAADGITPVAGATVGWTTTNNLQLSACSGATSCSVTTDQNGNVTTFLTPTAAGASTVTATLAPGVYTAAKSVVATLSATESSLDISALTPNLWISEKATATMPLTVRAVSNGSPISGVQISFAITSGFARLSVGNAQTNSNGYATVNLSVTQMQSEVKVSACVAPENVRCAFFDANVVPQSEQRIQIVSGAEQVSTGQAFQPVIVRVTDSQTPPNSVLNAQVLFQTTLLRQGGTSPEIGDGETNAQNPAMPVILSVSQSSTVTDINGLANIIPSRGSFSPPFVVDVLVMAGTSVDVPLQVLPGSSESSSSPSTQPQLVSRPVRKPLWRGGENR